MKTPITPIKLPLWIKAEINKRTKNLSKWMIKAALEKLERDKT